MLIESVLLKCFTARLIRGTHYLKGARIACEDFLISFMQNLILFVPVSKRTFTVCLSHYTCRVRQESAHPGDLERYDKTKKGRLFTEQGSGARLCHQIALIVERSKFLVPTVGKNRWEEQQEQRRTQKKTKETDIQSSI